MSLISTDDFVLYRLDQNGLSLNEPQANLYNWVEIEHSITTTNLNFNYHFIIRNIETPSSPKPSEIEFLFLTLISADSLVPLTENDNVIDFLQSNTEIAAPGPGGATTYLNPNVYGAANTNVSLDGVVGNDTVYYEIFSFPEAGEIHIEFAMPRGVQEFYFVSFGFAQNGYQSFPTASVELNEQLMYIYLANEEPSNCQIELGIMSESSNSNLDVFLTAISSVENDTELSIIRWRSLSTPNQTSPPSPLPTTGWNVIAEYPENPSVFPLPTPALFQQYYGLGMNGVVAEITIIRNNCALHHIYHWVGETSPGNFARYISTDYGLTWLEVSESPVLLTNIGDCTNCEPPPPPPPPPPTQSDPFILSWHTPGSKRYETGVDRGVIYFKDGRVVPWNGLTSVEENFGRSSNPVYFDGVKIHEVINIEGFSAQVSAITYPEEFEEVYGNLELRRGVYLGEQPSKTFGFSYRSVIGNEIENDLAGYKIHIIYNAIATPSDVSYASISDDPELTEFSWEFTTTPEHLIGYRPSAHIVVDTTRVSPDLVTILENILYGTQETPPALPSLQEVITLFSTYDNFINIVDNGDGTWTASTLAEGYINDLGNGVYEILEADIEWINNITYIISPTPDPPTP